MDNAPVDQPLNLSQLLTDLVDSHPDDTIGPDAFAAHMRDRVWGGLLLVFAAFNLLPLPPGTTTVSGVPLILISAQMAAGRAVPWFPDSLRRRSVHKDAIRAALGKFLKWERWIEKLLRPRLPRLTARRGTRIIGLICLVLSVILWLPIPFGNHLPAATMSLFALALLYRDGLAAIAGYAATLVSLAVIATVYSAAAIALWYLVRDYLPGLFG